MARVAERLSGRWAFALAAVVVAAPAIAGVALPPVLPSLEFAARAGEAVALRGLLGGAPGAGDLYLAPLPRPGFLLPFLWAALGGPLGPDSAGRLLVALAILAAPFAAAFLLRRLDRPPWAALAAPLVVAGPCLGFGRVESVLAAPLLLAGLGLTLGGRPALRASLAAVVAALLFSLDLPATLAFAAGAVVLAAAASPADRRPRIAAAVAAVATTAVVALLWVGRDEATAPCVTAACRWFAIGRAPEVVARPFVADILHRELLAPGYQWWIMIAGLLLLASALAGEAVSPRRRVALLGPAGAALLLVVLLPDRIGGEEGLVLSATTCLALLLLPAAPLSPRGPQRPLIAAMAAVVLLSGGLFAARALSTGAIAGSVLGVHASVLPLGSGLVSLPQQTDDDCAQRRSFHHAGGLLAAWRGARANLLRPGRGQGVLRYRTGSARARLAGDRCGESLRRPRLSAARLLDAGLSGAAFRFALVAEGTPPRPRGEHRPRIAAGGLTLYEHASHRSRAEPIDVATHCIVSRGAASCNVATSYDRASDACRRFGGRLVLRTARGLAVSWGGARFAPGRGWSGGERRRPLDYDCVVTDPLKGLATAPCAITAHAACRLGEASGPPAGDGDDALVISVGGSDVVISGRALSFAAARRFCAGWRATPVVPEDAFERDYFGRLGRDPGSLGRRTWLGRVDAWPAGLAEGVDEAGPVCETGGPRRGLDLCWRLHRFDCAKR